MVDDPLRMDRAGDWIYDRYDGEEADGDGADPELRSDGGDPNRRYALVEVAGTDAAWNVYE